MRGRPTGCRSTPPWRVALLALVAILAVALAFVGLRSDDSAAGHEPDRDAAVSIGLQYPDDAPAIGSTSRLERAPVALLAALSAPVVVAVPVVRVRRSLVVIEAPPRSPLRGGSVGLRAPPPSALI